MTSPRGPGPEPRSAVEDAAALGESTLAQLLARAPDGITIVDADRHLVYANIVARRMLSRCADDQTPPTPVDGEHHHDVRTGRLFGADGAERDIAYFSVPLTLAGEPHTASVFRDLAEPRSAVRAAVALAQTVAQLAGVAPINEVLAGISRHAVEATRALAAGISVLGTDHRLTMGGGYGPDGPSQSGDSAAWQALNRARGEDVIAALSCGAITVGGVPSRAVVLSDARAAWEADPVLADFAATMSGRDWRGAICAPLVWENEVIGVLGVYLPAGLAGPSEAELAFCTALADQAAIAVSTARLSAQAGRAATLEERGRLARELHDSVSQALFSMTMHARTAELLLSRAGVDASAPLSRSVGQLAELARGVLAEMRALIFELRPEALAEEGLVRALTKQAAALTAREHVTVTLQGAGTAIQLDPAVEEHVYRIVSEALHNVVKHARAETATITVTAADDQVAIAVADDGIGFEPRFAYDGHLGLVTMAQRAAAVGAELAVTRRRDTGSGTHTGTLVTIVVPNAARVRPAEHAR